MKCIAYTCIEMYMKCIAYTCIEMYMKCSKLAQREYKRRNDDVARYLHWQLCEKGGFERASKLYEEKPEGVLENENCKLFCLCEDSGECTWC